MRAGYIVFPGSNCDRDMAVALEQATGVAPLAIWHTETSLPPLDLIAVPGGFSFGDYLRSGAIAARSPVMRAVAEAVKKGVRVLGVCNGFQILTEAGLLPGALMRNASLRFVCRTVPMTVANADTDFTRAYAPGQVVHLPIAHMDGSYRADPEVLARLEGEGQVVLRYCAADGSVGPADNPNGAQNNIAGIVSADGRVVGAMPHPERAVDPLHGGTDGRGLFESLVRSVA